MQGQVGASLQQLADVAYVTGRCENWPRRVYGGSGWRIRDGRCENWQRRVYGGRLEDTGW